MRDRHEDIPDSMFEDAAVWRARMDEPVRDPSAADARQTEFERWLAADARHARAFEESERLWGALAVPTERIAALEAKETRRVERTKRPILRPALMAACVAVLVAVGAAFHDDLLLPLASDHRTAVGERTPIALADGSRVTLNTDTAITVDFETESRRVRLLQGEAWFDVAADGSRPFIVETPAGLVRVTGTSFGVRLHGETTVVSLTEGNVELMPESDEAPTATPLSAGHRITYSPAGVSAPTALDKTTATAWLRGQMVFFDARLADVIAELNRYRSGHIVITKDDLGDLRINGVFSTDDPDAALDAIANTLPVHVVRLTDLLILLH